MYNACMARIKLICANLGPQNRVSISPESFAPVLVNSVQRIFCDISLKLVLQSSFHFFINNILRDLQDVSPCVATTSVISYGMQHGCTIRACTPVVIVRG